MVSTAVVGAFTEGCDCHRSGGAKNPSSSSTMSPPLGLFAGASRVAIACQPQENVSERLWTEMQRERCGGREGKVPLLLSIALSRASESKEGNDE